MPVHRETRQLPYTAEQMFAVVADIERYPQFVPGCAALRVLKRESEGDVRFVTAEVLIASHGLRQRYVSRVTLDARKGTVEAHHVEGPFDHLDTRWRFTPAPNGSEVDFFIDFAFRNRLLSAIAGLAFDTLARGMAGAFVRRADALYGASQQRV
ncbi:MAG: type II toxin-antitoxin system RatA family toxin [Proteobacteria bacterium]|nr:type II toxin-antitoxin system RatA family toxin [Pseudomonadota bacterium]